ncbi:MAG TPA: glycosyltransferase [Bacillota bacterium]|nr:glycosyltransferase [Bacillota bacterium]
MKDYFLKRDCYKKYSNIESVLIYGKIKENIPSVSIVIPTYKRPALLKEAIDSALHQKYFDDYEIVIVDNEDNFDQRTETEDLIFSYNNDKIIYYRNRKNIGMFGNWNRCIELANGKWVCMLNDDDLLEETYLYEVNNALKCGQIYFLGVNNRVQNTLFKENDPPKGFKIKQVFKKILLFESKLFELSMYDYIFGYPHPTLGMVFDRLKALELGGFDENYYPSADYYFAAKFQHYYGAYFLNKRLCKYRIVENASLKNEVCEGFITNDFEFSKYLINQTPPDSRNILFFLRQCFCKRLIKLTNEQYGQKLNDFTLFQKMGISKLYLSRPFQITGDFALIVLRIYLQIFRKKIRIS